MGAEASAAATSAVGLSEYPYHVCMHRPRCVCCRSLTHIPLLSKAAAFVWKHKRLLQLWLLPYGLVAGNPRLEEMTMMYVTLRHTLPRAPYPHKRHSLTMGCTWFDTAVQILERRVWHGPDAHVLLSADVPGA